MLAEHLDGLDHPCVSDLRRVIDDFAIDCLRCRGGKYGIHLGQTRLRHLSRPLERVRAVPWGTGGIAL